MAEIILAHSELTNTIYALIGKEKIDITEQAIAEVKAIKALEQESKRGHWIEHIKRDEFDDYEEVFYKCSECGIEDCYKFTYCPHCGAKMDSEVEQ